MRFLLYSEKAMIGLFLGMALNSWCLIRVLMELSYIQVD